MIENKDSLQENAQNLSKNKLGGTHTTVIGGRAGKKLIKLISQHPELKKVIPSVISVKGVAGGENLQEKSCELTPGGKPEAIALRRQKFPGNQAGDNSWYR